MFLDHEMSKLTNMSDNKDVQNQPVVDYTKQGHKLLKYAGNSVIFHDNPYE